MTKQKDNIISRSRWSGLAFLGTDLGHIFSKKCWQRLWCDVERKRTTETWDCLQHIVRKHSLLIYTDLFEINLVAETRFRLLSCFYNFEAKSRRHYNQWTTKWCIRLVALDNSDRWSKDFVILFTLNWETRVAKNYPLVLFESLVLFWCLEKFTTFNSNRKAVRRWLLKTNRTLYCRSNVQQRGRGFGAVEQVITRTAILLLPKSTVPAEEREAVELLGSSVPKVTEVVSGTKIFKTTPKSVGR